MRRMFQIIVTMVAVATIVSCAKDNLYVTGEVTEKITSIIVVSDDYSAGMPSIQADDNYSYSGFNDQYSTDVMGDNVILFSSTLASEMPSQIDIKVNPSNATIDGVEWKVIRRATTTGNAESVYDVYDGDIVASRSTASSECVCLSPSSDDSGFFTTSGYVYFIVAEYADGVEVVSDAAALKAGEDKTIRSLELGLEINGVYKPYSEGFTLSSSSIIIDLPKAYGVLEDGTRLSFEQMRIDEYKVVIYYWDSLNTYGGLSIDTTQTTDPEEWQAGTQWQVYVGATASNKGYEYNTFLASLYLRFLLVDLDTGKDEYDSFGLCESSTVRTAMYYTTYTIDISESISSDNFKNIGSDIFSTSIYDFIDRVYFNYDGGSSDFYGYYATNPVFYINGTQDTTDQLDMNGFRLCSTAAMEKGTYNIKAVFTNSEFANYPKLEINYTLTITE